ncbi:MAG: hypothetical protein IH988_06520 [Planctomycetes bacterium]|nr:hypothetical protein [Planctomycetota bacterium]
MNTIDYTAIERLETCPPQAVISGDLQCVGCGYNLRTMQVAGRCSECGLAVERSFLVLPQPVETAKAIKLAAYALVVNLAGLYVSPFQMVAMVMLLLAAYQLQHRCKLSNMSELARKVRWFWITIVISAMVLMLSASTELTRGEYRLLRSTIGSNTSVSMMTGQTRDGQGTVLYSSDMEGSIEVTTDAQGRREVALLDDSGNVVSAITLGIGQTASVRDSTGRDVRLNLDGAGMLTIQARASSKIEVYPNGNTSLVTMPAGYLGTLLVLVLGVVGLAAMILYLLVCRALAIRSNHPRLARRFTIILWMIVTAPAVVVVVLVGAILGLQSKVGLVALMVPLLAAVLCLLVAAIGQIVASLQLSSALQRAPRHWSEVAAVPGGE